MASFSRKRPRPDQQRTPTLMRLAIQHCSQAVLPSVPIRRPTRRSPPSAASAETSAEPTSDQTLQPGGPAQAADEPDSNQFGDYEIIQEIARGGMGVVYKARQVSLNRTG